MEKFLCTYAEWSFLSRDDYIKDSELRTGEEKKLEEWSHEQESKEQIHKPCAFWNKYPHTTDIPRGQSTIQSFWKLIAVQNKVENWDT